MWPYALIGLGLLMVLGLAGLLLRLRNNTQKPTASRPDGGTDGGTTNTDGTPRVDDETISRAIDAEFQKMRRRGLGLPETASEAEVRAAVARRYGLPEDCTDKELSDAIDREFQKSRRRGLGLPEDASAADVRAAVAKRYGLPVTCSDKELSDAIDREFQKSRRTSLGLPETASDEEVRAAVARRYGL